MTKRMTKRTLCRHAIAALKLDVAVAQFELPSVFHPPPCLQICLGHLFKQPPVQCELFYLMVVSIKLKKLCFSRNLVGTGGFLDSQTTDTQFFRFGDSQSMQGFNSLELLDDSSDFLVDDKSSDTSDSTETVTPCSVPTDTLRKVTLRRKGSKLRSRGNSSSWSSRLPFVMKIRETVPQRMQWHGGNLMSLSTALTGNHLTASG